MAESRFCTQALLKKSKIKELHKGMRLSPRVCLSVGLPGLGRTAGRGQRHCDLRHSVDTNLWAQDINRMWGGCYDALVSVYSLLELEADQKRTLIDF